ncbi:ATP-binding protein [Herbivorax sp. ANBcel31]|uniref:sensor histidine kinase n=1 Tax=Herbivorax sp. ANBcel31 TaxID=3069754 RepID=UPI0027B7F329|nr:ATP-binding protein [Herbivorax sp. ANBcel31]MDQ2085021.1 ATP-binding protein [Herbivorax sp. ANBcel31]
MLKTLFSKIVVIFVAILLVSTSITGVMLYVFLGNFVSQEKEYELNESAKIINSYLTYINENADSQNAAIHRLHMYYFEEILSTFSYNTDSVIWIVSPDGKIVESEGETRLGDEIINKLLDGGALKLPDERQYNRVMQGNEDYIRERGDFFGLFKETGVSWLTIARPLKIDEEVALAVYLHTPIPEVERARTVVFNFFIFSVFISIMISIVLIYIFSLRLSSPLKKINNAAKLIANGEFGKRLNISSSDEIGELSDSFNNMANALEKTEEMRRGFVANVSHELRTPMTSIRGFIEGILDGTIPKEKEHDYLTIVKDETDRLNRLTTDLLDLAKIESGEMELTPIRFNINELIRRCIIKMQSHIIKKNIFIEANFENEDMFVKGDLDSIERVIMNLIHNAVKFVGKEGKIILTTKKCKERALISIEDNGIGIDEKEINLIWERFYKTDKSRGVEKKGTGLGLAIVKNIINEHGQEIWVESKVEKGTKFSFTLDNATDVG